MGDVQLSKRMAYVLRHRPDAVGLRLDPSGWVDVGDLAGALGVSRDRVERVVRGGGPGRYELTGDRVRARYGHSVPVDLGLAPARPPAVLWHGTSTAALPQVLREGLQRRSRQAVHLSLDRAAAVRVGARHGRPALLRVDAAGLVESGRVLTPSGEVWLVDEVPVPFLAVADAPPVVPPVVLPAAGAARGGPAGRRRRRGGPPCRRTAPSYEQVGLG